MNASDGSFRLLTGKGDGTVALAATYSVGCQTAAVAVGEFDGNAISDLAVLGVASGCGSSGPPPPDLPGKLTVFLGAAPALSVTAGHSGNFTQGQNGATYTVAVRNTSALASSSGTVTLTNILPAGMTLVSMNGTGWTCPGGNTCTRSDALAPGATFPPITVTVSIASNAGPSLINTVTVSGGGDAALHTATDPTIVLVPPSLSTGRQATQSSTFNGAAASRAIDGNTDGNYSGNSLTHTNLEPNPWWQVDLGSPSSINSITLWNRSDCCASRLADYWVFISNTPFSPTDTPATLQGRANTWSSHQTNPPNPSVSLSVPGAQGQFVRIQLSGTDYLSLAEVQIFGTVALPTGTNLAAGKSASQSSTFSGAAASRAIDGNTDGNYFSNSLTHTNLEPNPWWQVDLGAPVTTSAIVLWNRTDCCSSRLADYWVFVSNTPFSPSDTPASLQSRAGTWSSHQSSAPSPFTTLNTAGAIGQFVRIQLSASDNLSLAEVQVFGTVALPTGSNLAAGKSATQSSTLYGASASRALDGNTDGNFFSNSLTHTNLEPNPWWQVDLGTSAATSAIVLWNRTDCCSSRLADYWVFVSNTPFSPSDTPATLQSRAGTWSSHQTSIPSPFATINTAGAIGQYVRIQLSASDNLSLAEVQVFGTSVAPTGTNLSAGKSASQSSTLYGASASRAVDGNTDGNFFSNSLTHTFLEPNPWWQVDLGAPAAISSISLWNRTDCCSNRLADYWVFVSNTPFSPSDTPASLQSRAGTWSLHQSSAPSPNISLNVGGAQGQYVRIQLSASDNLSLAEVQVFGTLTLPTGANLAVNRSATQSSTLYGASASRAVDNNTDGNFSANSLTHTNSEPNPWWQVDLGASASINSLTLWNRTDCCGDRLADYWVFVSNSPFSPSDTPATLQSRAGTWSTHQTSAPSPSAAIPAGATGRYVRIQLSGTNVLSLAEVQVIGTIP